MLDRARIERWLEWRKVNLNGHLHHLFVLFKIIRSPSFEHFITRREGREIADAVRIGPGLPIESEDEEWQKQRKQRRKARLRP
jgi:hypothetical protein